MGCSPPGASANGILQARLLEWVAISSSRGSSWPRDWTHISCISCIGRHFFFFLPLVLHRKPNNYVNHCYYSFSAKHGRTWKITKYNEINMGLHGGNESACQCRRCKRCGFDPWVRKICWIRKWQSTPVFLLGKSNEKRSLVGYSPWGCRKSYTTEHSTAKEEITTNRIT